MDFFLGVQLHFTIDRTFVLEHYGKSKLTAKLVDKFREDVANGKIKL